MPVQLCVQHMMYMESRNGLSLDKIACGNSRCWVHEQELRDDQTLWKPSITPGRACKAVFAGIRVGIDRSQGHLHVKVVRLHKYAHVSIDTWVGTSMHTCQLGKCSKSDYCGLT